jgi:ABC-type polar amino acid transport system ATPase subunit
MIITFNKVNKKFASHQVLSDINFEVQSKEVLSIIGPSGSGKSTILRCMIGLEAVSEGNIMLNNLSIKDIEGKKLLSKMGMVFQHFNLFPHFTVLQNITYPIDHKLLASHKTRSKAEDLLQKFNLTDKINTLPKNLSGGQKQRVAICRALMMDPEILLFDEPTSALDPNSIKGLVGAIEELKHDITIIIVTHFVNFAKIVSDRIIFLNQGHILADQKSEDFFKNPASFAAKTFVENSLFEF